MEQDYSHPCIIGWCPINETHKEKSDRIGVLDDLTRGLFLAAKAFDTSRPVLDASGYCHRVAQVDVYDCHDYTQDPQELAQHHAELTAGRPFMNTGRTIDSLPYRGQPFFVSEFGGIWWNEALAADGEEGGRKVSWGYGQRPESIEEFYDRFEALCCTLLDHPAMFGYCYTQLTDVYQEQNGVFTFDRQAKFDLERLRGIQQREAAMEIRGT